MRIEIEFFTDNAAFEDDPGERTEVIEQAARKACLLADIEDPNRQEMGLFDSNGNRVGTVSVVGK
jgi:hypothetical protein